MGCQGIIAARYAISRWINEGSAVPAGRVPNKIQEVEAQSADHYSDEAMGRERFTDRQQDARI